MGGLDFAALPFAIELFGINDVEAFVRQLAAIRDTQNERLSHGH